MVKVVLHNEQNAEDNAMLQALYSRSANTVTNHLDKLKEVGSGKFMEQYYLNYGHASIADCGFITVYIEGVSMLAAKAIQDNPLYNGQESSSRYIDWSFQEFYNPYISDTEQVGQTSTELLEHYRNFYITQKPVIIEHLKQQYPKLEEEKQTIYEKSIQAKAFDILRGFLPCGATTNVSWTTSLRKANEHLSYLSLHPLNEVRDVTKQIHALLLTSYPNSIAALPDPSTVDSYHTNWHHYYTSHESFKTANPKFRSSYGVAESKAGGKYSTNIESRFDNYSEYSFDTMKRELSSLVRPRKAGLPKHDLRFQSMLEIYTTIDFGSYRDLQRHRAGYCSVPLITPNRGALHSWYYDQLPDSSKCEALKLIYSVNTLLSVTRLVDNNALLNQYLLPMGTLVGIHLIYNLHESLYVAELRSSQTVHSTLRPFAQKLGQYLENLGIKTYCDFNEDIWNTRRGNQDITIKEKI